MVKLSSLLHPGRDNTKAAIKRMAVKVCFILGLFSVDTYKIYITTCKVNSKLIVIVFRIVDRSINSSNFIFYFIFQGALFSNDFVSYLWRKIYVDALEKSSNIEFLANSSVSELIADERVTGIRLSDGRELEVSGLFVSIGRKPASEIFRGQLELDAGDYIVADESTRTNIAGVYAVGDVRTKPLRQVVTAVGDGAVAVHFAEEYLSGM